MSEGKPLSVVGYIRVSTDEQAINGVSLNAQEARIRAYCQAKELRLVAVVRDEGASGKNLRRDGMRDLITVCGQGTIDAVVVVKLDRLSRRTRDLLYLVEDIFERNDVSLHSLNETVDTSSASGRFFLRIMGALAEMEREVISERTAAALGYKKARGERVGAVPLGYEAVGAALRPVPTELETVRLILDLWQRGRSYRSIAAELNSEGARTKHNRRWHHTTIAKLVRNRERYLEALRAS